MLKKVGKLILLDIAIAPLYILFLTLKYCGYYLRIICIGVGALMFLKGYAGGNNINAFILTGGIAVIICGLLIENVFFKGLINILNKLLPKRVILKYSIRGQDVVFEDQAESQNSKTSSGNSTKQEQRSWQSQGAQYSRVEEERLRQERESFEKERATFYREKEQAPDYDFFAGVKTKEELKKRYRDLLKIYHPDNQAGDETMMKLLMEEYEKKNNYMS